MQVESMQMGRVHMIIQIFFSFTSSFSIQIGLNQLHFEFIINGLWSAVLRDKCYICHNHFLHHLIRQPNKSWISFFVESYRTLCAIEHGHFANYSSHVSRQLFCLLGVWMCVCVSQWVIKLFLWHDKIGLFCVTLIARKIHTHDSGNIYHVWNPFRRVAKHFPDRCSACQEKIGEKKEHKIKNQNWNHD